MNRIGFTLSILISMTGGAFAACESRTDTLSAGTVAFMCPADTAPAIDPGHPSESENVSVVEKIPDADTAVPAMPQVTETPLSKAAEVKTVAARTPADEPAKAVSAPIKPDKKTTRLIKSKKAKPNIRKTAKRKKGRIIHLDKPSLGRRIVQFFGG